jgi:hypothetical protein
MRHSDSSALTYKLAEHATIFSMMLGQWPSWMLPRGLALLTLVGKARTI